MSEPLKQFDVVCDLEGYVGIVERVFPSTAVAVRQNIVGGHTYEHQESLIKLQGSWEDLRALRNQLLLTADRDEVRP